MKIGTYLIAIIIIVVTSNYSGGQNVAITDDDGYTANPSAMLDVKSTTKGILIPRVTTAQRDLISPLTAGLLVYDSTEDDFYFYTGTSWIALTTTEDDLWLKSGSNVYVKDSLNRVGIGTNAPIGKLEVKGNASMGINDPLFEVINASGDTVFAVYSEGVRIYVSDNPPPPGKADNSRGGFAVGGFSQVKGITNEYLRVTPDSVRIYIDENGGQKASGSRGGFAVGGFSEVKVLPTPYFNITGDTLGVIDPSEARVLWYPTKEALLSGKVLIESADSVGKNSMATGFESKAIGDYSQALGYRARAFGYAATAIGNNAQARSNSSFAFGDEAIASGVGAYAFGSVGRDTSGVSNGTSTIASGNYSFSVGLGSKATNIGSFAFGVNNTTSGKNATTIGLDNTASGTYSLAIGRSSTVSGKDNIAIGWNNTASSNFQAVSGTIYPQSVAIGTGCSAGYTTGSTGSPPIYYAIPSGQSVAIGRECIANSKRKSSGFPSTYTAAAAVAIGREATAEGIDVFAIGAENSATGDNSMSFGHGISVTGDHSIGFALSDQTGTTLSQSNAMAIMGGDVGINTNYPEAPLDVKTNASGYAIHLEENVGSEEWQLGIDALGNLNFYDGTTARVMFEDGGYVGINTTTPSRNLHIKQSASNVCFRIESNVSTDYWDLGIGSTTAKFKFYFNGVAKADINDLDGAYSQLSDKRLKKNIEPVGFVLDRVIKLQPSKFHFKTSSDNDQKSYGFIAQEVEELFPDMITSFTNQEDPTVYKGLTYDDFAVISIQAIIDLNTKLTKEIDEIKADNQKMAKDFETLKAEISEIKESLSSTTSK